MSGTTVHLTVDHRWSGWPGAWCLDCGVEDVREIALVCTNCDLKCGPDDPATDVMCEEHSAHPSMHPCPEPGSNRHNPYVQHKGGK